MRGVDQMSSKSLRVLKLWFLWYILFSQTENFIKEVVFELGMILKWSYWKKKRRESILGKKKNISTGPESKGHAWESTRLPAWMGHSRRQNWKGRLRPSMPCKGTWIEVGREPTGVCGLCRWHDRTYVRKWKSRMRLQCWPATLLLFVMSKGPIYTGLTCQRGDASWERPK